MNTDINIQQALVDLEDRSVDGVYFEAGDDRTAATRRAIVRAAAEDWR